MLFVFVCEHFTPLELFWVDMCLPQSCWWNYLCLRLAWCVQFGSLYCIVCVFVYCICVCEHHSGGLMPLFVAAREIWDRRFSSLGFIFSSEREVQLPVSRPLLEQPHSFPLILFSNTPPTQPHAHTNACTHTPFLYMQLFILLKFFHSFSLSWSFAFYSTQAVRKSGDKLSLFKTRDCLILLLFILTLS